MIRHVHHFMLIVVFVFLCAQAALAADNPDKLYRDGKYAEAAKAYDALDLDNPKDPNYRYNRGCAAYQLKDYQSAGAAFSSVFRRAQNDELRFKAMYNQGNTAYQAGQLSEAVDAYKQALRFNPESNDARYNLELALRKIQENKDKQKKQQQQQQQNQNNGNQGQNDKQGQDKEQKSDKNGKDGKSDNQDQQKNPGKEQQGKNSSDKQDSAQQNNQQQGNSGKNEPQDLSGELKSADSGQDQQQPEQKGAPQQMRALERAKAEALIDNTSEDRSQFMKMRVPQNRRHGAPSGKYW